MRIVVTGPGTVTDRSFQNASDYAVHRLVPGVYPAVWTTIDGRPASRDNAYYLAVTVRTVLLETGGTNRLFQASSQHRKTHDTPSTYSVRLYAYQIAGGEPVQLFGGAGRIEDGPAFDKIATPFSAFEAAQCARDDVVYHRGMRLIKSLRTVSLDHLDRPSQEHAHIPGDRGMVELPPMWIRTTCDCNYHYARRLAEHRAWRAEQRAAAAAEERKRRFKTQLAASPA